MRIRTEQGLERQEKIMSGAQRREEILQLIRHDGEPVSGTALAKHFGVSRQVIVQDIALLRARSHEILSTNRGYICGSAPRCSRVLCACHTDEEILPELYAVVDFGGTVEDVFVEHEIYGQLRAEMAVNTRKKAQEFTEELKRGNAAPLKNLTCGYHYHTILADSEETLDAIEEELRKKGYLVKK